MRGPLGGWGRGGVNKVWARRWLTECKRTVNTALVSECMKRKVGGVGELGGGGGRCVCVFVCKVEGAGGGL